MSKKKYKVTHKLPNETEDEYWQRLHNEDMELHFGVKKMQKKAALLKTALSPENTVNHIYNGVFKRQTDYLSGKNLDKFKGMQKQLANLTDLTNKKPLDWKQKFNMAAFSKNK